MPPSDGWYLLGPFIAVALVGLLGAVFWALGLRPAEDPYEGLAIFDDYGLLCPAAITEDHGHAEQIRDLLAEAGIKSTSAVRPDGRVLVLVFPETAEEARRVVGLTF
ncbi:hypothetical protein [Actinoplanes sp. N902-109]|uniref:hypothetical protein n=1 Tax=Actinoplanes sp. (strain N902-109) TaxID=649831 RepID=UPI0003295D0F|nr:hypothetical protein [Actinoplanes sp. N902-109]AGL20563.1 hypothetical protein L083_7053 [Actinoplanes sp. N902-109]